MKTLNKIAKEFIKNSGFFVLIWLFLTGIAGNIAFSITGNPAKSLDWGVSASTLSCLLFGLYALVITKLDI